MIICIFLLILQAILIINFYFMRVLSKILIGVFLFCLLAGCKHDNTGLDLLTSKAELYVSVGEISADNYTPQPVKGAIITTRPETGEHITDEFGSVLLRNLLPGTYEVIARMNKGGSGKGLAQLSKGDLQGLTILLQKEVNIVGHPVIERILPVLPANFAKQEKVVFLLNISDKETPALKLNVSITSSCDGVLYEGNPESDGQVKFEASNLSAANHEIEIKVTDNDGNYSIETFELSTTAPNAVKMISATEKEGSVELKWEPSDDTDFARYEVYRAEDETSEGELIASFNQASYATYTDHKAPLIRKAYYFVRILTKTDMTRDSERIKVDFPGGKIYYYLPGDIVHHPSEPILYIIDNAAFKLRALNYQTGKEIASTSLPEQTGNIAIADNGFGLEIYVPANNGILYVYKAENLNLETSIRVSTSNLLSVASNGNGFMIVTVNDSWNSLFSIARASESQLSNRGYYRENVRFIPKTNNFIGISNGVSPTDMTYYTVDEKGVILSSKGDPYHGDYDLSSKAFKIAPSGEYLVTGYNGTLYAANQNLLYLGAITQRYSQSFADYEFGKDGSMIYCACYNRNAIQVVNYPELIVIDEITTKGKPSYLFNFNKSIVSVIQGKNGTNHMGVEVFDEE